MTTMKRLIGSAAAKVAALTFGLAALCAPTANAAGFDGKPLTTNDWFDVGFSGVEANTPIAAGDTTWTPSGSGHGVDNSAGSEDLVFMALIVKQ